MRAEPFPPPQSVSPVALSGIVLSAILLACQASTLADPTPMPATSPTSAPATPQPARTHTPGSTTVLIPGGTTVQVSLVEQLSSATANKDDTVAVVVTKEVDVDGFVVIAKGANGQATVASVDRAGGNGHGGKLGLTFDWVFGADGEKIQLTNVAANSETGDQKGAASTATIATYVLLGPLGLFAHNFVRGKDVTIPTDRVFTMFVDHDVHIDATQKSAAAPGFAS